METQAPQNVTVKAQVIAAPDAKVGDVVAYCVGKPAAESCEMKDGECTCTVRQLIYVEFPVTFTIQAEVVPAALADTHTDLLPEPQPIKLLNAAKVRPRPRPLLFVLSDWLRNSLFPRRGQ